MTTMLSIEICVAALANVIFMWLAYFVCWRRALLDQYRQTLFTIRDDMFVDAAKGNLSFDDPAYGILRYLINCTIATSSSFTFWHMLLWMILRKPIARTKHADRPMPAHEKFHAVVAAMPDQQRARAYLLFEARVTQATVSYMLAWTPIIGMILFFIPLVMAAVGIKLAVTRLHRAAGLFLDATTMLSEDDDCDPDAQGGPIALVA